MKTKRNLWPACVVLAFVLFATGTATLIVVASRNPADLVSANYYEDEVAFQGEIEKKERARQLSSPASIAYDATAQCITVALPQAHVRTEALGRVDLYRPSSSGLDRTVELKPDARGLQRLDASQLKPGLWKVRISWNASGEDYLAVETVVIGARKS